MQVKDLTNEFAFFTPGSCMRSNAIAKAIYNSVKDRSRVETDVDFDKPIFIKYGWGYTKFTRRDRPEDHEISRRHRIPVEAYQCGRGANLETKLTKIRTKGVPNG